MTMRGVRGVERGRPEALLTDAGKAFREKWIAPGSGGVSRADRQNQLAFFFNQLARRAGTRPELRPIPNFSGPEYLDGVNTRQEEPSRSYNPFRYAGDPSQENLGELLPDLELNNPLDFFDDPSQENIGELWPF